MIVGRRATFEKDRTGPLNAVHRRPAPGRTDCPAENSDRGVLEDDHKAEDDDDSAY